jgi:hypothetical protein
VDEDETQDPMGDCGDGNIKRMVTRQTRKNLCDGTDNIIIMEEIFDPMQNELDTTT